MDWDDNRFDGLVAEARFLFRDSEPDYDAYIADLESQEEAMIDVATYDDWFPDLSAPR